MSKSIVEFRRADVAQVGLTIKLQDSDGVSWLGCNRWVTEAEAAKFQPIDTATCKSFLRDGEDSRSFWEACLAQAGLSQVLSEE